MKGIAMRLTILAGIFALLPGGLFAQSSSARSVSDVLADGTVKKSLASLNAMKGRMADRLAEIAAIPSPSGSEHQRAARTADWMRAIGLSDVIVDSAPNATGMIPGAEGSPLVKSSVEIARFLGHDPRLSNAGSSNMKVAIAGRVPAIGIGGERGGERGSPGEWADVPAMLSTAKHVFLLAVAMGNCTGAK